MLLLYEDPDAPDLATIFYPSFRGQGYGTEAFALGAAWCLRAWGLERVYAGCYEGSVHSRRMQYDYALERAAVSGSDKLL